MTNTPTKPPSRLGAEKLTSEEQRRRFEELAREAGCDEGSGARFDEAIQVIARHKIVDVPNKLPTPRGEE